MMSESLRKTTEDRKDVEQKVIRFFGSELWRHFRHGYGVLFDEDRTLHVSNYADVVHLLKSRSYFHTVSCILMPKEVLRTSGGMDRAAVLGRDLLTFLKTKSPWISMEFDPSDCVDVGTVVMDEPSFCIHGRWVIVTSAGIYVVDNEPFVDDVHRELVHKILRYFQDYALYGDRDISAYVDAGVVYNTRSAQTYHDVVFTASTVVRLTHKTKTLSMGDIGGEWV